MTKRDESLDPSGHVAIVAMSGRFPGAPSVEELWPILERGEERIADLSPDELRAAGVEEAARADPHYVARAGVLEGIELFDAGFFGYSPAEAARLDPQQRLFLECAWEAFEAAGYDVRRLAAPVGVFAGAGTNSYFFYHFFKPRELLNTPGAESAWLGAEKDFLATRVSYELGLRGPGVSVQTACSTSLVAVHLACQSLLGGECDLALAGGASVRVPQTAGYFHQAEGILSPDGRCRAYDAEARGTVTGSGVGAVLLKRYDDAVADGDPIRAVILGSAVNNDGRDRIGFTAPGVEGQAAVIGDALAIAGIDPATVGFVEGHGTGTRLGDPIEVTALNQAFRLAAGPAAGAGSLTPASCALGSIKTNLGHLDAAAGVAGLIKAVLALERGRIPPNVHFRTPSPRIDFAAGPFYVPAEAADWPRRNGAPRRAGVSSFGLGGTNAHVVLQEAPEPPAGTAEGDPPARDHELLVLSAATEAAAGRAAERLAEWLVRHPEAPLADVAYTLQVGRAVLPHRRAVVCGDRERAAALLVEEPMGTVEERRERPVAFLLPGLGEDYAGMGRRLYESEEVFRDSIDRAAGIVRRETGADLLAVVAAERGGRDPAGPSGPLSGQGGLDLRAMLGRGRSGGAGEALPVTVAQPALFAVEHALAELWGSWGVEPAALLGYSLGEYVAACLAGVMPFEQALWLVARRAERIAALPPGAMLAVPLPEAEVAARLAAAGRGGLGIGAVNGPGLTVVAGAPGEVGALQATLAAEGYACRRLVTDRAFHTAAMAPIADEVGRLFEQIDLAPPRVPYVSNATGTWVRDEEATDPAHWVRQLVQPVRFAAGLAELARDPARVLLEVGPGSTLGSLAIQGGALQGLGAVPCLPGRHERRDEVEHVLAAAGKLWLAGAGIDWSGLHGGARRRRLALPAYPFERRRHWVETAGVAASGAAAAESTERGPRPALTAHGRPGLTTPYEAPRSELERELALLWEELLGVGEVGVRDSFFELGGHSLLATQLLSRIAARHGVELTLARFFEAPTVAGVAGWLAGERLAAERAGAAASAIPRRPPELLRPPLSFAQQRAWLIDRLEPGNPSYNVPNVLRLEGRIDLPALRRGLVRLGERHEGLRTTFAEEDGRPYQEIHDLPAVALPLVDLSGLPAAAREAEARRVAAVEIGRPFDLARGPLVRTALVRLTRPAPSGAEHLFVVTFHHVSADGWSLGVFVRELAALYVGRELPPLPVQYADFALWQRGRLQGERLEELLAYWRGRLEGAPRALDLPTDRPRPPRQGFRGRQVTFRLPSELLEPLLAVGRACGATPFMTLLAAFLALLQRWSGAAALPVGTPIANRTHPELEALIGFFTNTLVLVGDVSGEPSVVELIDRVRATALGAFDHQDLPFERLVEELEPERDLSRSPLFQVMFALQDAPREPLSAADLVITPVPLDPGTAKFDLMLELHPDADGGGGIDGAFEYPTDLFDRTTVQRLVEPLCALIAAAASAPYRPVTELPWLPAALAHQVTREWPPAAPGAGAGPEPGLLHAPVHAAAARTPDAVALVEEGDSGGPVRHLSYAELTRRAGALADELRRRGAGPGAIVALAAGRSLEASTALLGILSSGAAYLPLDPTYPEERRRMMAQEAGVRLAVEPGGRVEGTDGAPAAPADRGRRGAQRCGRAGGDLAYVIYTSGSTGRPKGVAMPHRPLAALVRWQGERSAAGPGGRWGRTTAQLAPLGFDVSCQETFAAWSEGGRLVVVPEASRRDPAHLLGALCRHRVERLFLPFVALATLASHADQAADQAAAEAGVLPDTLSEVITAGERLRVDRAVRRAFARSAGARLDNQYGPTETHVATAWALPADPGRWNELPPIGRAVAGARAVVADPALSPVPPGTAGELLLGGACLARGYLGRPGLTAERFVPDPFAVDPADAGSRLYATGDLARHRPDGALEFLGRRDDQLKVRGYRIEPAEVEAALAAHPAVADSAVAAWGDGAGRRLVAYAVPRDPEAPALDEVELLAHLRARLPEPMVPGRVIPLDQLPTTPSGKVDRRCLPPPEAAGGEAAGRSFQPPRTPAEERMAGLWRELLGVERVGASDGFFALGGHSLLAAQLVSRVRGAFGVELPLRHIFERPVLADLAAAAAELAAAAPANAGRPELVEGSGRGGGDTIPLLPRDEAGAVEAPASSAQEGLWLIERLRSEAAYHLSSALRLTGPVVPRAVRAGIERAIARHEVLRTSFTERDGRPVQRVGPPRPQALPVVDLSALPGPRRGRVLAPLLEDASARPFDLARPEGGGLLRALLVREGAAHHVLLLTLHHAVCDGWSLPILVDEMVAGYRGEAAPPPLPVQYADFAAWQRERLAGARLEAGFARGRERLAGAPTELELPRDRSWGGRRAAALPVALEPAAVEPFARLARGEEATLFMALAAAFQAVLGRWSGRDDLLIGAPVANRVRPEIEPLIGLFVNVLVLRGRLAGAPGPAGGPGGGSTARWASFRELLGRSREDALAAYADQEMPFERLVERLQPKRESGRNPLVQAVLAYQGRASGTPAFGAVTVEPIRLQPAAAKFDLLLELEERAGGLSGAIEYPADRFDETTVRRLWGHLARLVAAVAGAPDRPLDELCPMSPAERQAVLVEWNDTGRREGAGRRGERSGSLVARFRSHAERAPERVALVHRGEHLSYRELARRSDALAARLRALGVAPDAPVGVILDRSAEAIVAFLGVLAAGGAYVPLDPATPAPMLSDLVEELGLDRAVTESRWAGLAEAAGLAWIDVAPVLSTAAAGSDAPAAALPPPPGGTALAYALFTSGSTGRPKAVGATHGGVIRLIREPDFAELGPDESLLQLAPLAFDASTLEIWGALARGGRLVVAPAGPRSLAEVAVLAAGERITNLWLTSGLFHQMVDVEGETLAGVPYVLTGGDVVSPRHAARHLALGGRLVNGYGPTEATTFTTTEQMRPGDAVRAPLPIGRPIPETRVAIAGPDLRALPVGVAGELTVGGSGLARGYLGRPAATAERFVPDPWPPEPGGRLYRSGDLARFLAGGKLDFLGRIDRQVKVRGFRVEPGEVEAALEAHPGVAEAVVVLLRGRHDGRGAAREDRLVAYWVPSATGGRPDGPQLRRFLERSLPRPVVPSVFVPIAVLPLTANGKIDRGALPAPEEGAPASKVDSAVPAARAGRAGGPAATMAGLWAEVLGAPPSGPEQDFFDSGGHSLDATRLLARVRQVFGVELPLRELFESPTFGALAAAVETARPAPREEPAAAGDNEAPLSFAQERLWFIDELTGGTGYYNVPVVVELAGRLDLAALAGALRTIEARHDALRTRFAERGGRPVQVVAAPEAVRMAVPMVDLTGLAGRPGAGGGDRAGAELRRLAAAEAWRPFDLERGPLWRVGVARIAAGRRRSEDRHAVFCTMHHIVSDGWSTGVLLDELAAGYRARAAGQARVAPEPLPLQYPEFARRQRAELEGEPLERLLDWWRDHLSGAPAVLDLPTDRPRPPIPDLRGAGARFHLPRPVSAALARRGREHRATLFMTLLAALQVLLQRWTGQDDFIIGSPIANRQRADLAGMIGFFVNTLALRSHPSLRGEPQPTFTELLAGVRRDLLGAYEHQDLPFERLVEELVPRRDLSRQPLVQVVLALQNAPRGRVALPGLTLTELDGASEPAARFDLTFTLHESEEGLGGGCVYPIALFEPPTIARLVEGLRQLLEAVTEDPDRPVTEIPIPALDGVDRIDRAERRRPRRAPAGELERLGASGRRARERAAGREAPRSPLEATVAEVWREVLGVDELGIHEDFFDLGGHSLLATQVVAQLRDRLGQEVSLEELFEAPTVAGLAERMVGREAEEAGDEALAELLAEIDDLDEEEVEDLLREEVAGEPS